MRDDKLPHGAGIPIDRLIRVMQQLRDPNHGCPWDIEQDFASIAPYTIEEAYEVEDAIARQDWQGLCDELGDLLLQVVFHARMAEEAGLFDFDDVARGIVDKMIRRHPHVFGEEGEKKSAQQQTRDWEAIKARERAGQSLEGTLDGIALGLPALSRAVKLQKRAARVGFDWPQRTDVLNKLAEEMSELEEAIAVENVDDIEDEFGDILFVMANYARHLGLDPEAALRRTNNKFRRRFNIVEDKLKQNGRTPSQSTLAEMDTLWEQAKREE